MEVTWCRQPEGLGFPKSEQAGTFLSKAQKILSNEELSEFRSLMQQHSSNHLAGLSDLLIAVRKVCLGRGGESEEELRRELWSEFLGFVTPAQARSVFYQDWGVGEAGTYYGYLPTECPPTAPPQTFQSPAPGHLPKPSTNPAPNLCSTKFLSADSLMQLDSPVVCQVPSRARPLIQTNWQGQPRQKMHNECASGLPADSGSFPRRAPGQQVAIESTEGYAEAPDTLNRTLQGWWPLTGSTLRAAFEMMRLAAESAASIGSVAPAWSEAECREQGRVTAPYQLFPQPAMMSRELGVQCYARADEHVWRNMGSDQEFQEAAAAAHLQTYYDEAYDVAPASSRQQPIEPSPAVAHPSGLRDARLPYMVHAQPFFPLGADSAMQVAQAADASIKRRRVHNQGYGSSFSELSNNRSDLGENASVLLGDPTFWAKPSWEGFERGEKDVWNRFLYNKLMLG